MKRKIVLVNQAVNYLTIDLSNAFLEHFKEVVLITGSIHTQGEELNSDIITERINKWAERPASKKLYSYLKALIWIYWLLLFKYRKHEVYFISLPPMAYLLNMLLPNRTSVLIWDVYPDTFKITGMKESNILYKGLSYLNRKSFRKACNIFTISNKMSELLQQYVHKDKIYITPIWSIFKKNERVPRANNKFIKKYRLDNKFVVQYSGNIGFTHKVEVMLELAKRLQKDKQILFQIIGRGPRMPVLQKTVEQEALSNVIFLPFQSDKMFPYSLSAADIGVVILDERTSKGSVPSKSYNLMSFGIPSLYIAAKDSELWEYTQKYKHGECFSEGEINKAVDFILKVKNNPSIAAEYSENSLKAAQMFKKDNADKIVHLYMNSSFNI